MIRRNIYLSTRLSDTVVRQSPARLSFRLSSPIVASSNQKISLRYVDSVITNSVMSVTPDVAGVIVYNSTGTTTLYSITLDSGNYTSADFVTMMNSKMASTGISVSTSTNGQLVFYNSSAVAVRIGGSSSHIIGCWPATLAVAIGVSVTAPCLLDLSGPKVAYLCTSLWTNSLDSRDNGKQGGSASVGNQVLAAIPLLGQFGTATYHQNSSDTSYRLPHRMIDVIEVVLATPEFDELPVMGEWECTLEVTVG